MIEEDQTVGTLNHPSKKVLILIGHKGPISINHGIEMFGLCVTWMFEDVERVIERSLMENW